MSKSNDSYTPEALIRRGLRLADRGQVLSLLIVFAFMAGISITLTHGAVTGMEDVIDKAMGVGLIAAAPFIPLAALFGWIPELTFRRNHREAYDAGQNKLKALRQLPILERTILTRDQYGDKLKEEQD